MNLEVMLAKKGYNLKTAKKVSLEQAGELIRSEIVNPKVDSMLLFDGFGHVEIRNDRNTTFLLNVIL